MKALKRIAIAAAVYVGIVVLFETFLGVVQPSGGASGLPMLVLTTTDASGAYDRRLAGLTSDGKLYLSAHHWPRAWFRRALENPEVRVAYDDGTGGEYTAVPVEGEEVARGLGVEPTRVAWRVYLASSLLAGGVVALAGPIGFVGLVVPHILRILLGADHRLLLPASVLAGGTFLALCDTAARMVIAPAEVPVGVVTAMIGGPFFLVLLLREKQRLLPWA